MGLKDYKGKRKLKETPEPSASKQKTSSSLNFCVQKHDARKLHYDFRLECKGVLLSWAVPKGPSLDPKDKRLAIHVEDHPLDYQYFEGVIPEGNYGAGTVEIWDAGTFTTPFSIDPKVIEKYLLKGMKEGHIAIILHGDRLNGEFILQKLNKDPKDEAWLLIKKGDAYAKSPGNKKKMPEFISPMLATLTDQPFNDKDWLFEVKWDGFRAIAAVKNGKVQLKSRNKISLNKKFPSIVKELKKIRDEVILDGEIVALDEEGKPRFQLLQKGSANLCYYVFDILFKNGEDLRELPLIERKEILKEYASPPLICYSDHVIKDGKPLFKEAVKAELEGIMGKKINSTYESRRSPDWVKIKTGKREEVLICGFTAPSGGRSKFGSLIAGIYEDGVLRFVGHVGWGFDESLLKEIHKKLKPLITKKCPFPEKPKVNAPATWVKPEIGAIVSFSEWTEDQRMRHPIFEELVVKKTETNLDKVYWPKEKYTKGDLLAYYESMAKTILPYLEDRPIMLHRFPDGIKGKSFYQKDISFSHPDWVETFEVKSNNFLIINDERSLLYAINLGSIDLHPFLSKKNDLENPSYCVIDLDPHGISFSKVIEAALVIHEILDRAKVKHYCKTSGGKGLHIMIPFAGKYDFTQSRQFAELVCQLAHEQLPKTTSMERSPEKRPRKIYLDFLQNRSGQSIVAPYSVRPRPKALVSTPLSWDEVNEDLDPSIYTMETVPERVKLLGDLLKPLLGKGVDLKAALKKLCKSGV